MPTPTTPPVVQLDDVIALLGRFPALAGASLAVEPGEVLLVTGPNGAGKTTLLRAIAGLQRIDRGAGVVLGLDVVRAAAAVRRRVAYVGHDSFGYDDLTARENLEFAARAAHARHHNVDEVLARAGLERVGGVRHGGLSAGQRRRLGLARAMLMDSPLVLLDEPHAGLDEQGRALLDALLVAAPASGTTVILVSHELELARAFATREVRLVGGRIEPSGSPVSVPEVHEVPA